MDFCTALAAAIAAAPTEDVRNALLQIQYNFCNDGSTVAPSQTAAQSASTSSAE